MNDVLPPCGGFLPVYVESNGYIVGIESRADVHRETRDMHEWEGSFEKFSEAKTYVSNMPNPNPFREDLCAILELTPEGGGAAIWTVPENIEEVTARRNKWRGCYGSWPVRPLAI